MGVPLPAATHATHAFIRVPGDVHGLADAGFDVTSAAHCDIDGTRVTEALVSGPGALEHLADLYPGARQLVAVHYPAWTEQSLLAAAGKPHASPGTLAVHAMRAPEQELHLVSHPNALCADTLLRQTAACLDRWIVA